MWTRAGIQPETAERLAGAERKLLMSLGALGYARSASEGKEGMKKEASAG